MLQTAVIQSKHAPHQTAVWYPPHGRCTLNSGSLMWLTFLPLILLGAVAVLPGLLADTVADLAAGASAGSTVK